MLHIYHIGEVFYLLQKYYNSLPSYAEKMTKIKKHITGDLERCKYEDAVVSVDEELCTGS